MHRKYRHGLTLPELIIGTAMIAMIGAALASFTTAMAAGWTNSESKFKVENASKRAGEALETELANILYVAQSQPSQFHSQGPYLFYWAQDGGLVASDQKAQLAEMALIEYNATDKAVYIYKPKTSLTPSQRTTLASDNWGDPTSTAIISYFKSLDCVEVKPLVGGANSGIEVTSATWRNFTPTGAKSMTSYSLSLSNAGFEDRASGTVPSKAGRKPTNFN